MELSVQTQAVSQSDRRVAPPLGYDVWLIGAALTLLCLGLIMVVSASVSIAERRELMALHYFWRQLIARRASGLGVASIVVRIPLHRLEALSTPLLFIAITVLVAVLVPGLGREVNGSMRWISLGPVSLQASEPAKLAVVIYLAAYLVRHNQQVRSEFIGFIKPIGVLTVIAALFLIEPDFGAAVVLFAAGLGMLFLAGVPILRFLCWSFVALAALAALSMLAPYRLQRLMTFMDPWSDPYDSGFQLTQALIAFGRGEWVGVGLGNSVQKLYYLPEVHTDFVFAVIGEEAGMLGTIGVIALFVFLIWRIFFLGGVGRTCQPYVRRLCDLWRWIADRDSGFRQHWREHGAVADQGFAAAFSKLCEQQSGRHLRCFGAGLTRWLRSPFTAERTGTRRIRA